MTERDKDKRPFDEHEALGELEQFQSEIERYRQQRETVHQEFEQFVSSFPSPESVFPSEAPPFMPERPQTGTPPTVPPLPKPPAVLVTPAGEPPPTYDAMPVAEAPPAPTRPVLSNLQPDTLPRMPERSASRLDPSPGSRPPIAVLAVVLLLAVVGGLWVWNARRAAPETESAVPAAVPQAPAAALPPAETSPAAPAATTESVVTTVRRAWVRVIADGTRVVERELPADTRLQFNAEKTIVIRTGDAGAVRLSIRGDDQGALGRNGQVITRTFEVPAKPR